MAGVIYPKPPYPDISPISRVGLLWNVPLDNSYENTLTFKNEVEQLAYFEGKLKVQYCNALSPITLGKPIRIPYPADSLFDCNYCIISNGNFSIKNLFCFITKIEYVNMEVCLLYFEIDVMQTWYFNMNIRPCYVEREHVNDDRIGLHTLSEGVDLGYYVKESRGRTRVSEKVGVMLTDVSVTDVPTKVTGNMYSALHTYFVPVENNRIGGIPDFIENKINQGKENDIVGLQMVPTDFYVNEGENLVVKEFTVPKATATLDGYTPKNNKLRQYPYMFIEIDNTQGQTGIYKMEFFSGDECTFKITGSVNNDSPELVMFPTNYDNVGNNVTEHITLSGFPQCAWAGDSYKAYWANNSMKNAWNIGSKFAQMGAAGVMAQVNPLAALTSMANQALSIGNEVTSQQQEIHNAEIAGNRIHGTRGSNALFGNGWMDFWVFRKTIDYAHAKTIDDYLTRFGYHIAQIKQPNITGRKSWNYVKTRGSSIIGTIPFNDLTKINNIFDRGITFWHGDFVGDYSRDNSIV